MRTFELFEASTGRRIGSAQVESDVAPGALVLMFRQERIRVEEVVVAEDVGELEQVAAAPELEPLREANRHHQPKRKHRR